MRIVYVCAFYFYYIFFTHKIKFIEPVPRKTEQHTSSTEIEQQFLIKSNIFFPHIYTIISVTGEFTDRSPIKRVVYKYFFIVLRFFFVSKFVVKFKKNYEREKI